MASRSGEIMLNYVAPEAQFCGISTSLLSALESDLFEGGLAELSLFSTETAHRFYQARGWTDHGAPDLDAGVISYPMVKPRP